MNPCSPLVNHLSVSPNFGDRRAIQKPDMVILHYTGMRDGMSALEWLCHPESHVSCHYVVMEDGVIHQLVAESHRAWHAGVGQWHTISDINSHSIGIEIVNGGHDFCASDGTLPPYPAVQIESVIALSRDLIARWSIEPRNILAHSDIAPQRKQDPGEHFPWNLLHEAGVGHWVMPEPLKDGRFLSLGDVGAPIEALQMMLKLYGYGLDVTGHFDAMTQACVKAFQRHFRPQQVDGIADSSTITTLHRLLQA